MSDKDLLDYTVRFAASLRIFESNAKIAQQQFFMANSTSEWDQNQKALLNLMERTQAEYRNTYLQPAQQLRDEIMNRLQHHGIFIEVKTIVTSVPGGPKISLEAFDGRLVGPTPIADVADWLESAARKLQ